MSVMALLFQHSYDAAAVPAWSRNVDAVLSSGHRSGRQHCGQSHDLVPRCHQCLCIHDQRQSHFADGMNSIIYIITLTLHSSLLPWLAVLSTSHVLISTCSTPLVQTGECKQFSLFDHDLWPTTFTYNSRLAKVKVDPHAKNQGQTVQTGECPQQMDTHAHARTLSNVLSPLLRGR